MNPKALNTTTPPHADELLTKPEIAKRLRLCTRKIELMMNSGEIPYIKIGSSVRFNWKHVLSSLEQNQS